MRGYEFTERGKFIIVFLSIALLIIPAAVITFRAWDSSQSPLSNDPDNQIVQPMPNDPPPDVNGNEPTDPPGDGNGEQGSFNPPDEPDMPDEPDEPIDPDRPPEVGFIDINLTAGTMQFMFAPELQNALDTDTVSMLGEFLSSPRNTSDSKILIEVPALPANQTANLTSAITDAFSQYGVQQRDLTFEAYQSDSDYSSFVIVLTFIQTSGPK